METSFWFKLGMSFLVGGAWVTLSTVAAERFGSKVGGFIGGLPSTVVVALLFIGITQTSLVASRSTTIIPLVQGVNGLFIISYILFVKRGFILSLASSLLIWFLLASILMVIGIRSFLISVVGWVFLVLICYLIVERYLRISSKDKVSVHYTSSQIIFRALFGGAVIGFAVFMGKVAGPMYGGIFATFPAMFISTIVITHRTGGADFSRAVAKALMVSGLINVALYAIAVRYLYVWLGLIYGTAIAILFSCVTGYMTYLFIRVKVS